jgi:restriction system protein
MDRDSGSDCPRPGLSPQGRSAQLEEIVAAAYERAGWDEVILTPRSGDHGRDVIAARKGFGAIKIYEQIKRYKAGHVVTAAEVRELAGVLLIEQNVSKAILTTTPQFAPGVATDDLLQRLMPYRLELKNGRQLRDWLDSIESNQSDPPGKG